jgi:hypothetical protein
MCRCQQHAMFVLGCGNKTEEFGSKEAGYNILARLLAETVIDQADHRRLSRELGATRLPDTERKCAHLGEERIEFFPSLQFHFDGEGMQYLM